MSELRTECPILGHVSLVCSDADENDQTLKKFRQSLRHTSVMLKKLSTSFKLFIKRRNVFFATRKKNRLDRKRIYSI